MPIYTGNLSHKDDKIGQLRPTLGVTDDQHLVTAFGVRAGNIGGVSSNSKIGMAELIGSSENQSIYVDPSEMQTVDEVAFFKTYSSKIKNWKYLALYLMNNRSNELKSYLATLDATADLQSLNYRQLEALTKGYILEETPKEVIKEVLGKKNDNQAKKDMVNRLIVDRFKKVNYRFSSHGYTIDATFKVKSASFTKDNLRVSLALFKAELLATTGDAPKSEKKTIVRFKSYLRDAKALAGNLSLKFTHPIEEDVQNSQDIYKLRSKVTNLVDLDFEEAKSQFKQLIDSLAPKELDLEEFPEFSVANTIKKLRNEMALPKTEIKLAPSRFEDDSLKKYALGEIDLQTFFNLNNGYLAGQLAGALQKRFADNAEGVSNYTDRVVESLNAFEKIGLSEGDLIGRTNSVVSKVMDVYASEITSSQDAVTLLVEYRKKNSEHDKVIIERSLEQVRANLENWRYGKEVSDGVIQVELAKRVGAIAKSAWQIVTSRIIEDNSELKDELQAKFEGVIDRYSVENLPTWLSKFKEQFKEVTESSLKTDVSTFALQEQPVIQKELKQKAEQITQGIGENDYIKQIKEDEESEINQVLDHALNETIEAYGDNGFGSVRSLEQVYGQFDYSGFVTDHLTEHHKDGLESKEAVKVTYNDLVDFLEEKVKEKIANVYLDLYNYVLSLVRSGGQNSEYAEEFYRSALLKMLSTWRRDEGVLLVGSNANLRKALQAEFDKLLEIHKEDRILNANVGILHDAILSFLSTGDFLPVTAHYAWDELFTQQEYLAEVDKVNNLVIGINYKIDEAVLEDILGDSSAVEELTSIPDDEFDYDLLFSMVTESVKVNKKLVHDSFKNQITSLKEEIAPKLDGDNTNLLDFVASLEVPTALIESIFTFVNKITDENLEWDATVMFDERYIDAQSIEKVFKIEALRTMLNKQSDKSLDNLYFDVKDEIIEKAEARIEGEIVDNVDNLKATLKQEILNYIKLGNVKVSPAVISRVLDDWFEHVDIVKVTRDQIDSDPDLNALLALGGEKDEDQDAMFKFTKAKQALESSTYSSTVTIDDFVEYLQSLNNQLNTVEKARLNKEVHSDYTVFLNALNRKISIEFMEYLDTLEKLDKQAWLAFEDSFVDVRGFVVKKLQENNNYFDAILSSHADKIIERTLLVLSDGLSDEKVKEALKKYATARHQAVSLRYVLGIIPKSGVSEDGLIDKFVNDNLESAKQVAEDNHIDNVNELFGKLVYERNHIQDEEWFNSQIKGAVSAWVTAECIKRWKTQESAEVFSADVSQMVITKVTDPLSFNAQSFALGADGVLEFKMANVSDAQVLENSAKKIELINKITENLDSDGFNTELMLETAFIDVYKNSEAWVLAEVVLAKDVVENVRQNLILQFRQYLLSLDDATVQEMSQKRSNMLYNEWYDTSSQAQSYVSSKLPVAKCSRVALSKLLEKANEVKLENGDVKKFVEYVKDNHGLTPVQIIALDDASAEKALATAKENYLESLTNEDSEEKVDQSFMTVAKNSIKAHFADFLENLDIKAEEFTKYTTVRPEVIWANTQGNKEKEAFEQLLNEGKVKDAQTYVETYLPKEIVTQSANFKKCYDDGIEIAIKLVVNKLEDAKKEMNGLNDDGQKALDKVMSSASILLKAMPTILFHILTGRLSASSWLESQMLEAQGNSVNED